MLAFSVLGAAPYIRMLVLCGSWLVSLGVRCDGPRAGVLLPCMPHVGAWRMARPVRWRAGAAARTLFNSVVSRRVCVSNMTTDISLSMKKVYE